MKQQQKDSDALRFGTVRDPMHRDLLETRDIAKEIRGLLDVPETEADGPTPAEQMLELLATLVERVDAVERSMKIVLEREIMRSDQHLELIAAVKTLGQTLSGLTRTSGQQAR